jgi:hypothetical protein
MIKPVYVDHRVTYYERCPMTEDSAIRIDFDSAEFVHVTHTMEFFLRSPPELVPQDPWNSFSPE